MPQGQFFALLGPSGCGKTTTLRMVAGLDTPTSGSIHLGGTEITYEKPYRRPVNTVFQNYALFPHLDIAKNVAFGLERRGIKDTKQQVADMLELVELTSQARKKPAQMSGGQQQRVALARALINKPEVLLLDEPLGALDLKLRRGMQLELKRIQTEVGLTFVHVTHDQEEAMTMADTIAVMNQGVIEQMGAPDRALREPAHDVRRQLPRPVQPHRRRDRGTRRRPRQGARAGRGRLGPRRARRTRTSGKGWLGIRPEKVLIAEAGQPIDAPGDVITGGYVTDVSFVGVSTQYSVMMPWGQELTVFEQNTGARAMLPVGTKVDISWRPEFAFLLDASQDAKAGIEDD